MRKVILAVLVLVSVHAFGQNPTNYLLRSTRERLISSMVDSMLRIPRYCGVPSGVRVSEVSTIDGALAMDTCNNRLYMFSGNAWVKIANYLDLGTGSVDSIWRVVGKDSIFYSKNGTTYKIKDSTGAYRFGKSGEDDIALEDRSFTLNEHTFAWPDLEDFSDTVTWKPMVISVDNGQMRKATYWPGSGGGGSGMAIASLIASATQGSVLYAGTGGRLQQSNTRFYYDSTNGKLGIAADGQTPFSGSYLPKAPLHIIESQSGQPRGITIDNYGAFVNAGSILLRKGRGSFASPSAALAGDAIGSIAMDGYPFNTHTAVFSAVALENYSSGHGGSMFRFELSDTGQVSPSPVVYMTGIGGGKMGILNNSPTTALDVSGTITQRPTAASNANTFLNTNGNSQASTSNINPGFTVYNSGGNIWGGHLWYNSGTSRFSEQLFTPSGGDISFGVAGSSPSGNGSFTNKTTFRGDSGFWGVGTSSPDSLVTIVDGGLYANRGVRFTNLPSGKKAKQVFWDTDGTLYVGDSTGTGGGSSGLTKGTTAIANSATRRILYDSSGVLSDNTALKFNTSNQLVVGGNGGNDILMGDPGFGSNLTALTVNGALSSSAYSVMGNGTHLYLNSNTSGNIYFRVANSDKAQISANGSFNVGSNFIWDEPANMFTIDAGANSVSGIKLKGTVYPAFNLFNGGTQVGWSPAIVTSNGGFLNNSLTNDIAYLSNTGYRMLFGVGAGTDPKMIIATNSLTMGTRFETSKGADVASANDLTLGTAGNVFHITGTTTINAITTSNWQAGSEITLIFDSTPTVKNNTAGGAGTAKMLLAGAADFSATASDVLKLVYDGTNFYEISRSVN